MFRDEYGNTKTAIAQDKDHLVATGMLLQSLETGREIGITEMRAIEGVMQDRKTDFFFQGCNAVLPS